MIRINEESHKFFPKQSLEEASIDTVTTSNRIAQLKQSLLLANAPHPHSNMPVFQVPYSRQLPQLIGLNARSSAVHTNPIYGLSNSTLARILLTRAQPLDLSLSSTTLPAAFTHLDQKSLKRPLSVVASEVDSCTSGSSSPSLSPVPSRVILALNNEPSVANTTKSKTTKATTTATKPLPSSKKAVTSRSKKDEKWMAMMEELKTYKQEHGTCIVPRGYAPNPRLASWVAEQRKQFKLMKDGKQSSITPERILMLDNLGFAWNAQEAAWGKHMSDLKSFLEEHGHCHVPLNHSKYPKLGLWVKEQRRHYTLMKQKKQSHMTEARVRELTALGFCWDTHETTFSERLRELSEYKQRFGHCLVPTNYSENPKLGTWCHHQRRQYRKWKEGKSCHITEDRIKALERIGFVFCPRERNQTLDTGAHAASVDLRPRKRQKSF